jgi:S-adenosylmethionine hydrolase
MARTVRELEADLARLESKLDDHSRNLDSRIASSVERSSLQQGSALTTSLDNRIDSRFRTAFLFAGVILAVLSASGFLGLRWFVNSAVEHKVGADTIAKLDRMKTDAICKVDEIEIARKACAAPLIVLQTDYGTQSYYMGRLKGVIYSINPHARIDVITAEVADFDIINAAFTLWRASKFYPSGTIFVVITNPGGITTEQIAVETSNGHVYLGHDNGCLDLVVQDYGLKGSYRIACPELTPPQFRDLFGGVDVFGPTAAKFSLGFPCTKAGPQYSHYMPKLPNVQHAVSQDTVVGAVMDIDKYGNATTNISDGDLEQAGIRVNQLCEITLTGVNGSLQLPFKRTYGNVSKGDPLVLLYEGMMQLALNEDNFAVKHQVKRGTLVKITRLNQ